MHVIQYNILVSVIYHLLTRGQIRKVAGGLQKCLWSFHFIPLLYCGENIRKEHIELIAAKLVFRFFEIQYDCSRKVLHTSQCNRLIGIHRLLAVLNHFRPFLPNTDGIRFEADHQFQALFSFYSLSKIVVINLLILSYYSIYLWCVNYKIKNISFIFNNTYKSLLFRELNIWEF